MTDETKKQIAELKLTQILQDFVLKQLIADLDTSHPELHLKTKFQTLMAETLLHFGPDLDPGIADRVETYFSSLIDKPPAS